MSTSTEVEFCVCGHNRICHPEDGPCQECFETGKLCHGYDPGDQSGRLQELPNDILVKDREDKIRSEGHKDDFGKTNWFSVAWLGLSEMADVMTFGASKYETFNFRKGMKASRLFSAAIRHLFAWHRGEEKDEESGLSHLAHAACCILMLRDIEILGTVEDDRWKKEQDADRVDPTNTEPGSDS